MDIHKRQRNETEINVTLSAQEVRTILIQAVLDKVNAERGHGLVTKLHTELPGFNGRAIHQTRDQVGTAGIEHFYRVEITIDHNAVAEGPHDQV